MMNEDSKTNSTTPSRNIRNDKSLWARLRRKASKTAIRHHEKKRQREDKARAKGAIARLPKDKRHQQGSEPNKQKTTIEENNG